MSQKVRQTVLVFSVFALTAVLLSSVRAQTTTPLPPPSRLDPERFEPVQQWLTAKGQQRVVEGVAPNPILPHSRVVYQSFRDLDSWDIYRSQDNGAGDVRLTKHGGPDIQPRFNRGSSQIAYASLRGDDYEIYIMNNDGSEQRPLTVNEAHDVRPAWSPDGSQIAFESYRNGQAEIYVMNADGSDQQRLTFGGNYNGMPDWSPDGSQIAFVSARLGVYQIYVMNRDGSAQMQLSERPASFRPKWSPDGRQILFDSDFGGWQQLWLIDADGANEQHLFRLAAGHHDYLANGWAPDGSHIVYTHIRNVLVNGNWYWAEANVYTSASPYRQNAFSLTQVGLEWMGHWQTTDVVAPTIEMQELAAVSPSPFPVIGVGSDGGGVGIHSVDYQMRIDGGVWTLLAAEQPFAETLPVSGLAGEIYEIRTRGRDKHFNMGAWSEPVATVIESELPESKILPLPSYSRYDDSFLVSWQGHDPGHSLISGYDIDYKVDGGEWMRWKTDIAETSANFRPRTSIGSTYAFRSRATDHAQSVEAWSETADTSTELYYWGVQGFAYDNTHTPISRIEIPAFPEIAAVFAENIKGHFAGYFTANRAGYNLAWLKQGYGQLPDTNFAAGPDQTVEIVLPPSDDMIDDGTFEAATLADAWQTEGVEPPIATQDARHTGLQAAQLGQDGYFAAYKEILPNTPIFDTGFISVDQNNRFHLVVAEFDHFLYTYQTADMSWTLPETIPFSNTCRPYSRNDMETGFNLLNNLENGVVQLAWPAGGTQGDAICYTERVAGVWQPIEIEPLPYDLPLHPGPERIDLEMDGEGNLHVVWVHDPVGSAETIYYRQRDQQAGWSAAAKLAEDTDSQQRLYSPRVAISTQGAVYVVWDELLQDPYQHNLYARARSSSGQWSPVEPIATYASDSITPAGFHIILDTSVAGRAHLMFARSYDDMIFYTHRDNGGWTEPIFLGTADFFEEPRMGIDQNGRVHIAWWDKEDAGYYAASESDNISFTTQTVISDLSGHDPMSFAVGKDGTAHFFLRALDDGLIHNYYSRLESDGSWFRYFDMGRDGDLGASLFVDHDSRPVFIMRRPGLLWLSSRQAPLAEEANTAVLKQAISIPTTMDSPTLSFYSLFSGLANDQQVGFQLWVNNGSHVLLADYPDFHHEWRHSWFDMTPWQGQTVELEFRLVQEQGKATRFVYLDDVSLGSALPDVWVGLQSADGVPGHDVVHTVTYGNRGGGLAENITLTYTLPPELTFVSASIPPTSTNPLVWELGNLAGKSEAAPLMVTLQVAETAVSFTTSTTQATISTSNNEPEQLNNQASDTFFVGRHQYLPIIARQ